MPNVITSVVEILKIILALLKTLKKKIGRNQKAKESPQNPKN